ncbi:D-glucuronyl C5-epimerase family protein [Nitrospira sp. M1]
MQVVFYKTLFTNWVQMLSGGSYWHAAYGIGENFDPRELQDYYRNYSSKVEWNGLVDQQQIPLVQEPNGTPFYHPILLAQKALGHWSCWLRSLKKEETHRELFLQLAQWFVVAQEVQGSWKLKSMEKAVYTVPYSALAQGQAISVLVRAFAETSDNAYKAAAHRGVQFMLTSMTDGGVCRIVPEGLILEEYPRQIPNTVLNGWISALFGLHDWLILAENVDDQRKLNASVVALIKYLPQYNAGYWSLYDTSGSIASPYYHNVHITQLMALEKTFPHYSSEINATRKQFERQKQSSLCFGRACLYKAVQKIRNPPVTVFVQTKNAKTS